MSVWKPQNSPFWQMDFKVGRKRIHGTTKCKSKKDALAFSRRRRAEENRKLALQGGKVARDMTLGEAFDRYMNLKGRFTAAADDVERELNWILDHVGDDLLVTDFDDLVLEELVAKKRDLTRVWANDNKKLSPMTVNQNLTKLVKRIFNRVKKTWKIPLPDEPDYEIHMLKEVQRVRELSVDEEERLMRAALNSGYEELMQFMLASGLRKADALIRWEQVDERARVIRVIQKGDRPHEVRITPVIQRLLDRARGRDEEFVWTYRATQKTRRCLDGGGAIYPITYAGLGAAFKWIIKKAKVKDCRIHDLRKTAGSRFYRVTGDIVAVQIFLGHSNITITRKHYMHVVPLDIAKRLEACEAFYEGQRGRGGEVATTASQKHELIEMRSRLLGGFFIG